MSDLDLSVKQVKMLELLRELISEAKRPYGIGRMNQEDHVAVHQLLEVMHHLPGLAMSPNVGMQDQYWLENKVADFFERFPMMDKRDEQYYRNLFDGVVQIVRGARSG
ncbi:MAG: hypothetical protein FKY71_17730 [Spiribacter salinus]|uniref:Uncharacterized protein n=1 Tax=Spiribacter salinus TaxID=1335746 RepID=A0A540VBX4_9GAMM|nr:MAG: hypothetical protein FKY71_17730 [Spiribacter salinus]